jgi:hypothetical protein
MTEENQTEVDDFDLEDEVVEAPAEEAVEEKPKAKKAPAKNKRKAPAKKAKAKDGENVFTYVGKGEDSPRRIKFMGRQTFIRGEATEVTDEIVLAKVKINPCFVEGVVDIEDIADADEDAAAKANAQRAEDKRIDAAYKKRHG